MPSYREYYCQTHTCYLPNLMHFTIDIMAQFKFQFIASFIGIRVAYGWFPRTTESPIEELTIFEYLYFIIPFAVASQKAYICTELITDGPNKAIKTTFLLYWTILIILDVYINKFGFNYLSRGSVSLFHSLTKLVVCGKINVDLVFYTLQF